MSGDDRAHALARLRALMAMTVANGCTADEELTAARKVGELIARMDPSPSPPPAGADPHWAAAERGDPQYQALLARNTLEGLLKAALQELALGHINTVSPAGRPLRGVAVEHVATLDLLRPFFTMMLGSAVASRLARSTVDTILEELIHEGQLPEVLAIPRE